MAGFKLSSNIAHLSMRHRSNCMTNRVGLGMNVLSMLVIVGATVSYGDPLFQLTAGLPDWVTNTTTPAV